MKGFRKDLLDFIGRRIVVAIHEIKPKLLDDVCGKKEEECAAQEAVYLVGLSDGMVLAELLSNCNKGGEERCSKDTGLSPEV